MCGRRCLTRKELNECGSEEVDKVRASAKLPRQISKEGLSIADRTRSEFKLSRDLALVVDSVEGSQLTLLACLQARIDSKF